MLVKTVSVHKRKKNVDGSVQGAGAAYEGGPAGRVGHDEALQEVLEGLAARPLDCGRQQAAGGGPVEEDGGAGYATAGVVGGGSGQSATTRLARSDETVDPQPQPSSAACQLR